MSAGRVETWWLRRSSCGMSSWAVIFGACGWLGGRSSLEPCSSLPHAPASRVWRILRPRAGRTADRSTAAARPATPWWRSRATTEHRRPAGRCLDRRLARAMRRSTLPRPSVSRRRGPTASRARRPQSAAAMPAARPPSAEEGARRASSTSATSSMTSAASGSTARSRRRQCRSPAARSASRPGARPKAAISSPAALARSTRTASAPRDVARRRRGTEGRLERGGAQANGLSASAAKSSTR